MSASSPSRGEIRDYLLRRLPESRRSRIEELYFEDDGLLDRVEEAEDQLVSDYVLGRLSPADRKLFEDTLLASPYYRDRIETTTQMRLRLSRHKAFANAPGRDGGLRPGRTGLLVAVSLLFILFVAALASAIRLKKDLETATLSAAPAVRSDSLGYVLVVPAPGEGPAAPLRILLSPAESLLLVVPRTLLPGASKSWRITVRGGPGPVWQSGPIRAGGDGEGDLAVQLPPAALAKGRYEVIAAGDESDPSPPRELATLEVAGPDR